MGKIRIIEPRKENYDSQGIYIEDYSFGEVMLPMGEEKIPRKVIRVQVRGENLRSVAQPLIVMVGKQMVKYLRIAPDEKSVEGILLEEPPEGAMVDVILGDHEHVRHPKAVNRSMIKRME